MRATKQRIDAGDQFEMLEGIREEIVGARRVGQHEIHSIGA
jgi:hypothetical protein